MAGLMRGGQVRSVARQCTEHIVAVIEQYGWHRVQRQLRHAVRSREFICSMLYLMRTGVTYQRRCILPRVDALVLLLPLQVGLWLAL